MPQAHRIAPWELGNGEAQHDASRYEWHFLAEGDSWFSFGSFFGNSLLDALAFDQSTLITQTAMPGDTLARMADWWRDANFDNLLSGRTAWRFDAILLSGGGNDLIEALQEKQPGTGVLRRFAPGAPPRDPQDCIDEDAFAQLARYLRANFAEVRPRADASALNAATPMFLHTYDFATPRDSGAGFGKGPWLCSAFRAHGIPEPLWVPLMELLFARLRELIRRLEQDLRNVFVVDTCGTLERAPPGDAGETRHWLNEIHPNRAGYALLAQVWKARVEAVLVPPVLRAA